MKKNASIEKLPKWYTRTLEKRPKERKRLFKRVDRDIEDYIKNERKKGKRIPKKRLEGIRGVFLEVPRLTHPLNAEATADLVCKTAELIEGKKILINNIGFGCNIPPYSTPKGTFEPFFIANKLKKIGKDYQINSYAFGPLEVQTAKEQKSVYSTYGLYLDIIKQLGKPRAIKEGYSVSIPKDILQKIKFNQLDLITETPAKQADITTIKGVPLLKHELDFNEKKIMTLLKNAVDSTKSKGYIICNKPKTLEDERKICKTFRLKKIEQGVYQKM